MGDNNFSIFEDNADDKSCRLILKGRITSDTAAILGRKLDEVIKTKNRIVLNMQQVSFLSSGGIRVLLMYYKITKGQGGSFYVESPSNNVVNVLGLIALDEMLLK